MGFFDKLKKITTNLFSGFTEADEAFFEELEETLILADLGMDTALDAVEQLRTRVRKEKLQDQEEVKAALRDILAEEMAVGDTALDLSTQPSVVLFIGVNGVGKTTSIGKLAHRLKSEGKRVLLCAADTFRAAAADQLEIWAERAGCEIVRQHEGADPGAVLFDALQAAKARGVMVIWVVACAAALLWLDLWTGGAALLGAGLTCLYYRVMSARQFGGVTGDLAGFFLQICELAMVLAVVLAQKIEVLV